MTDKTVTSIVHHHIKPNEMASFLLWLKNIKIESQKFDGYIDTNLIDTCGSENERISIFRFQSKTTLDIWLQSDIHKQLLLDLSQLTTEETTINTYTGLEYWFDRAPKQVLKMSVLTYIALLPLVLIVPPIINKIIPMSSFMLSCVGTATIVLIMSYFAMPLVMKIYSKVSSR